jgi:hypothetical protein
VIIFTKKVKLRDPLLIKIKYSVIHSKGISWILFNQEKVKTKKQKKNQKKKNQKNKKNKKKKKKKKKKENFVK